MLYACMHSLFSMKRGKDLFIYNPNNFTPCINQIISCPSFFDIVTEKSHYERSLISAAARGQGYYDFCHFRTKLSEVFQLWPANKFSLAQELAELYQVMMFGYASFLNVFVGKSYQRAAVL